METAPVLVLGDGGWGTSLAMVLHHAGRSVRLWSHDAAYARSVQETRRNPRFLPGVELPRGIEVGADIEALARGARCVLSVVPTQLLRAVLTALRGALPGDALYVSCSKGFERGTLVLPSRILAALLPRARIAVLSGPSHAEEVSRGLPTTVVAASSDPEGAREVQRLLATPRFRIYRSGDPLGVEVGGAAKNVIALAAGISDGLAFGDNARSGLITRGLREVTRLGMALGAREETFAGLSGLGDLVATCTSRHSRNHEVGTRIAAGESLERIVGGMQKVAEGVETTRSVCELGRKLSVDLPIAAEVHRVLFEGKAPREAVEDLMGRESKDERA
ncbi:MAG: NAD(P)-dependent glycerol-3-phosphate dehydrogenase [Planctomycetes bacterium]|nr:NAD(P)-dependent glycerol-3-phosphate dehydrogenase [Planctomycetota bacterium]